MLTAGAIIEETIQLLIKCKETEQKVKYQDNIIRKGVFDNKQMFQSEILKDYEVLTQQYTSLQ